MQGPPVFGCRAEPPRRAGGRACVWRVRSPKKEKGSTTKNRGCAAGKWISWMLHTLRAIRKSSRRLSGCVIGRQPYRNTGKKAKRRTVGKKMRDVGALVRSSGPGKGNAGQGHYPGPAIRSWRGSMQQMSETRGGQGKANGMALKESHAASPSSCGACGRINITPCPGPLPPDQDIWPDRVPGRQN